MLGRPRTGREEYRLQSRQSDGVTSLNNGNSTLFPQPMAVARV